MTDEIMIFQILTSQFQFSSAVGAGSVSDLAKFSQDMWGLGFDNRGQLYIADNSLRPKECS